MTTDPSAMTHGVVNVPTAFRQPIDLMDETLREGAERSSVSPSLEAKVQLGVKIAQAGIRTIVVGMFPDVPHNVELLDALLEQQREKNIADGVRFIVISHVGETMRQTLRTLAQLGRPLDSVWVLAIHSASDQQIQHLFPTILRKDASVAWDDEAWQAASREERQRRNLEWLEGFLPTLHDYRGGGIMVGLLDSFRADFQHLQRAVALVARLGFRQIRLVDTAGTCLPQQAQSWIQQLVEAHPNVDFYGHFHDDFGMATANALIGLSQGLKGVDVSVGGFANRAGHPPLAEVAMALHHLCGVPLEGFRYDQLFALSREVERTYGLMESPTQAITGVITHSILSGIRTELLKKAPTIFDVIDPRFVGSGLTKTFGVRSGRDGMLRFLREHADRLKQLGLNADQETADRIHAQLVREWQERSNRVAIELVRTMQAYQELLQAAFFSEDSMLAWVERNHGR